MNKSKIIEENLTVTSSCCKKCVVTFRKDDTVMAKIHAYHLNGTHFLVFCCGLFMLGRVCSTFSVHF